VDEPLAEDTLEIKCNSKEVVQKVIQFTNPSSFKDISYKVDTDLPDILSGPTKFTIPPKGSYDYVFSVRPLVGKIYFGKLIFKEEYGNMYKWYTVKIESKSLYSVQAVEMKSRIRKAIYVDLTLNNPTNEVVRFSVDYQGDYLMGAKELRLDPESSGIYQLFYEPLQVGVFEGILHLFNDSIGEFLYKLTLICEDSPPTFLETIKAELGKSAEVVVTLENPSGNDVEVATTNTNMTNFTTIPDKILIKPYLSKDITIKYTPSSISTEELATIVFISRIGKWDFRLNGKGIIPKAMEPTNVSSYVGGITSGLINFKNPFKEVLNLWAELKCETNDSQAAFKLITKKDKFTVESLSNFLYNFLGHKQIPFTFSPSKLTKYYAEIIVYLNRNLFWTFPIIGITEVKSSGVDYYFKTKSKKMLDGKIVVNFNNGEDIENEIFSFFMKVKDEKYNDLIGKCLTIGDLEKDKANNRVNLNIKFYPLRPFKSECEFIISKNSGGQYICNIILEATEPDIDDVIHIQSSLGKISTVSFKLQNVFTKNSQFVSYFSHDSSSEFSVIPREGVLDQSGR